MITDNLDNTYKFTGHERDTESGLDHTLYRKYASNLARWHSPDPLHGKPANPQSWNRYTYAANNPCNAVDPAGASEHWPETWPWDFYLQAAQRLRRGLNEPSGEQDPDLYWTLSLIFDISYTCAKGLDATDKLTEDVVKRIKDPEYIKLFRDAAQKYGVDPRLVGAIAVRESGIDPNVSLAGDERTLTGME